MEMAYGEYRVTVSTSASLLTSIELYFLSITGRVSSSKFLTEMQPKESEVVSLILSKKFCRHAWRSLRVVRGLNQGNLEAPPMFFQVEGVWRLVESS